MTIKWILEMKKTTGGDYVFLSAILCTMTKVCVTLQAFGVIIVKEKVDSMQPLLLNYPGLESARYVAFELYFTYVATNHNNINPLI